MSTSFVHTIIRRSNRNLQILCAAGALLLVALAAINTADARTHAVGLFCAQCHFGAYATNAAGAGILRLLKCHRMSACIRRPGTTGHESGCEISG